MNRDLGRLLQEAIANASAAATAPDRWDDCITAISEATNAAGIALFRPGLEERGLFALQGSMAVGIVPYWSHWVQQDPWNIAAKGTYLFQTAGEVRVGREFLTDENYRRTAYHDGHGRRYDTGHRLFLKICDAADPLAPTTHLTLNRSFRQGPFGPEERKLLSHLWPHLQRAVRTHVLLQQMPQMLHLTEAGLNQLPYACWVVRADQHIDFANIAAEAAMKERSWLAGGAGRLLRLGDLDERTLAAMIADAARSESNHRLIAFQEKNSDALSRTSVRVVPIRASPLYAAAWPHAQALVLLELPPSADDPLWVRDHVAPHYRLTPMEGKVLELLVEGNAIPDIASALHISEVTVRTHLRSLREKTGRRSQAQLVRLGVGR